MTDKINDKPADGNSHSHNEIKAVFDIVQWLLIALILALYFRGFVMEAYRIPTGSMANTLKGAHFNLYCVQCGFKLERDFESSNYDLPYGMFPVSRKAVPKDCVCSVCGHNNNLKNPVNISNGDRILVLKCLYQFFQPKRWDVIVFRDPTNPKDNMIKRLIGLPGEKVQIKNGDIYINGKIVRKSYNLQTKLWIPIYNNDYQPVKPDELSFNNRHWINPIRNINGSKWKSDKTKFILTDNSPDYHWLEFYPQDINIFKADIVYNGTEIRDKLPYCSDIMIRYHCKPKSDNFTAGAQLSRYGEIYRGWFNNNNLFIGTVTDAGMKILVERPANLNKTQSAAVSFSIVDNFIEFKFGNANASYNLKEAAEIKQLNIPPKAKIFGSKELIFSHLVIYRDIYYTDEHYYRGERARGAGEEGFILGKDEFFVLGDNSSASYDSRWWTKTGFGNNKTVYTTGIVPRDYLLGKAVFVYWPGGFGPFKNSSKAIIPNIGQIRFIHGGTE